MTTFISLRFVDVSSPDMWRFVDKKDIKVIWKWCANSPHVLGTAFLDGIYVALNESPALQCFFKSSNPRFNGQRRGMKPIVSEGIEFAMARATFANERKEDNIGDGGGDDDDELDDSDWGSNNKKRRLRRRL